jgi:peptidoglycan-N-acetylglucosamine deacetylase
MKRKLILIAVSLSILLIVLGFFLFQISKSRTFQFFGTLVSRIETDEKVVALTLDDAPTFWSDEVIGLLDEQQVKATFYLVGKAIEKLSEQAKRVADAGHELGNHSYSHERFLLRSPQFIASQIEQTNSLIRKTGYIGHITFRPPNGKKLFGLPLYLAKNNITTIMWDVEPDTYVPDGLNEKEREDFIVNYTVENTRPGSIILIHPFCEKHCAAIAEHCLE